MLTKVREWIRKHNLLSEGEKILVACSGGPDSLALLHIFETIRLEYNISIFAVHVDHMFRGDESAQEAAFVVDFCQRHHITCYHTAIDVPQFIKQTGLSSQDAARHVRYEYLRNIGKKLGGAKIATGHHRDDQAETVLIHILRGAGSAGIRGMQASSEDVIRPLLAVSKAEIMEYCSSHNLQPQFDSSNLKTDYLRNRIRISLLPQLENQYNIAIKDALCRTAIIVGDEHNFIQRTGQEKWSQIVTCQQERLFINGKQMELVHIAVKREIIRLAIEEQQGSLKGISFYHIETLLDLLANGQVGNSIHLPDGLVACKSYDGIYLGGNDILLQTKVDYSDQVLEVPGTTIIPELGIKVITEITDEKASTPQADIGVFDWSSLSLPIYVRKRLDGDKFQPSGFRGSKKLKDFFIDAKVPRKDRDSVPIICDSKGIIWVGGYRQAEGSKTTSKTTKVLKIKIV